MPQQQRVETAWSVYKVIKGLTFWNQMVGPFAVRICTEQQLLELRGNEKKTLDVY